MDQRGQRHHLARPQGGTRARGLQHLGGWRASVPHHLKERAQMLPRENVYLGIEPGVVDQLEAFDLGDSAIRDLVRDLISTRFEAIEDLPAQPLHIPQRSWR